MYPWHDKGNVVYRGVLIFQFILGIFIGFFTDSLLLSILVGSFILSFPLILFVVGKHMELTRHVAAISTQLFAALHIQQMMGATYMHFEIFAVMAVTSVYRDRKVVVSSVIVVAIHHIGFYALQASGTDVFIFEAAYLTLYILVIHALFAIAEGAVLCLITKKSEEEAISSLTLTKLIHDIMKTPDTFNLNVSIPQTSTELRQFSSLINSFSGFISKATKVSSNISNVSDTVMSLSSGVKSASIDTSAQVSTIAAATEEMTANNHAVAERALDVNRLSQESKIASQKANEVVSVSNHEVNELRQDLNLTAEAIQSLSEKCHQIEQVMASITAISDQTNLLALNAAIESARAGEHGRGFAVVADEVRQLAMRTKDNTQQISEITNSLIEESNISVDRMKGCVDRATQVSDSSNSAKHIIDTVVEGISEVSENMSTVSIAIKEQSAASQEIARSTNELATTSEALSQSADVSEESAESLQSEVQNLRAELNRFD
jgi:methyl-accepting chemotaxis protein